MTQDKFFKVLEKQINEKYYTPKELQYDNEVNIHFSSFEFQTFLSLKEELCDKGNKIFTILPLKTFGTKGKYTFFVVCKELELLTTNYLQIIFDDFFENKSFFSIRNKDELTKSRIYSEIEGTLNVESVPTTRKRLKELTEHNVLPKDVNDIIIKNMSNGVSFIEELPKFTKDNLNKLYRILSDNCLKESDRLLEGEYYRTAEVEIGRYMGCPYKEIDTCMNSLFEYVNKILNSSKNTYEKLFLPYVCHYYLLYIHPYIDYNGRTARMISYWIQLLLKEDFIPPIVSEAIYSEKSQYYRAIELTRDTRNDLTYFLKYILNISTDLSLCYLNIYYIQKKLREKGYDLTGTELNYLKKILISCKGPFKYTDFIKYCDIDISKQGALKILNYFIELGILKEAKIISKSKFFEINKSFIKYNFKNS